MAGFEQRTKTALSSISPDTLAKMPHKDLMKLVQDAARETGELVEVTVNGGRYVGCPVTAKGREDHR